MMGILNQRPVITIKSDTSIRPTNHYSSYGCVHEVSFCRCNTNERCRFIGRFAVWAFAGKREFQTDQTQAFIALRYRELDLFSFDPLRLTFATQKLAFIETSFWLLFDQDTITLHTKWLRRRLTLHSNVKRQRP